MKFMYIYTCLAAFCHIKSKTSTKQPSFDGEGTKMQFFLVFVAAFSVARCANTVSDADLTKFSQVIWNKDVNRDDGVKVNLQGYSVQGQDKARQPLFKSVSKTTLQKDTYKKFIALLDNYETDALKKEVSSPLEESEISAFIQAISNTEVIKTTHRFLLAKGLAPRSYKEFLANLKKIWFDMYPPDRSHKNLLSSSGFEHVFLGEVKRSQLVGLHNWVAFYLKEKSGSLDYTGHKKTLMNNGGVKFMKFTANLGKFTKPISSMLVGSSPEFEMALYTVCFYARPNTDCKFTINNKKMAVKSFVLRNRRRELIATAYPLLL